MQKLSIKASNRFVRHLKKSAKRGKDPAKVQAVIELLCTHQPLPKRYRPHLLKGSWVPFMECHVEPDWLLVYRVDDEYLYLEALGTHADIFR